MRNYEAEKKHVIIILENCMTNKWNEENNHLAVAIISTIKVNVIESKYVYALSLRKLTSRIKYKTPIKSEYKI